MGKFVRVLLIGVCFFLSMAGAYGQEYPSRPIEYVVGYPPGGVQDPQARGLCKAAEKYLGQPISIVNKPGMSGELATTYLSNQKPDGYTIGQAAAGVFVQNPFFDKVSYKIDDFCYIIGFGFHLHGLSVRTEAPWNTFRAFLDYAKKNPGKIKYATYSPVSTTHMVMDLIAKEEGIDWTHIPYKGDGAAITALLGGHLEAVAVASGQVPYIRSGKLKLLAIFNDCEFKEFSQVPTLRALGYKFPMLSNMTTYTGVVGPKGIKPGVMKKLQEAFTKATQDPIFVRVMESLSTPIVYKSGKEFETEVKNYYQICEKVLPAIAAKMK